MGSSSCVCFGAAIIEAAPPTTSVCEGFFRRTSEVARAAA
jgi:hypothetical protein